MKDSNDVFHLSLTEFAFTIIMILILLLGPAIVQQKNKIQEQDGKIESLIAQLTKGTPCTLDPDDPIDNALAPCVKCLNNRLRISKKDADILLILGQAALDGFKESDQKLDPQKLVEQLKQASKDVSNGENLVSTKELAGLQDLKNNLEQAKRTLDSYKEQVKEVDELKKSLDQSQKAVAYFKGRAGGGYPPCWQDDKNRIQYLFNVEIENPNRILVSPAWSSDREAEANSNEDFQNLIKASPMTLDVFRKYAEPILSASNKAKPEACRHYIRIRNMIPDRKTADKYRLNIENYFYKYEVQ